MSLSHTSHWGLVCDPLNSSLPCKVGRAAHGRGQAPSLSLQLLEFHHLDMSPIGTGQMPDAAVHQIYVPARVKRLLLDGGIAEELGR